MEEVFKSSFVIVVDKMFACVEKHTHISREEIILDNRSEEITDARAIMVTLLRRNQLTWSHIGRIINRDYSTCIYLSKKGHNMRHYGIRALLMMDIEAEVEEIVKDALKKSEGKKCI